MEKEKLENQENIEKDLEKTAGGYSAGLPTPLSRGGLLLPMLGLTDKEYNSLKNCGYIKESDPEITNGRVEEYISKTKLKKALRILNKNRKANADKDDDDDSHVLSIV